jgi:hypothetical protein
MNLDQKVIQSWDKFLNPEKLKDSLVKASLFLSAYEILKESIIDKLRSFFTNEWHLHEKTGELKGKVSKSYKEKVTSLCPKDEFHACCLWFRDQEAINESDLAAISKARKHRNEIAHELPKYISSIDHDVNKQILESLVEVVRKIDVWWISEIEIPTNPDFEADDMDKIDFDNVVGGNTMFLSLILSIFEGDDSHLKEIHALLIEKINKING